MPEPTVTPPPAPTPTPAPSPSPSPAPSPSVSDNPFAEIDKVFKDAGHPGIDLSKEKPGAPKEDPKPEPKPEPDPKVKPEGEKRKPENFRIELDRVKNELKSATDQRSALEKRIAEFEAKGKETAAMVARHEQLEKQIEALKAENRSIRFEASDEYKKDYEAPYNLSVGRAKLTVEKLNVLDEAGQPFRKGNFNDFVRLYQQYREDPAGAIERATTLFGQHGSQIIQRHIEDVDNRETSKGVRLAEEQEQWDAKSKADTARQVESREKIASAWATINKELHENTEEYHDPVDDSELSDLRQKGYQTFDAPIQTMQQKLVKDAHIRQRVAAFGPNQLTISRLKKKVGELEKELSEIRNPQAKNPKSPGGKTTAPAEEDWEEGLRKHMAGVS